MTKTSFFNSILFFLLFSLITPLSAAKVVDIKGIVTDAQTSEPIPYVSVYIDGTTHGVMTAMDGTFSLSAEAGQTLKASSIGYVTYSIAVSKLINAPYLDIRLVPSEYQLKEVTIKPKKEKYTNKGNPAVEFVRNVIEGRNENDPKSKPYYSYERYEKLTAAFNEFDEKILEKKFMKKFGFLKDQIDTSDVTGKPLLIVSNKELIEENYFRNSGKEHKQIVTAFKRDGMDEIISQDNMQNVLGEVFKEVDIYQNDISLFLNRFVSPISSIGPNFYKYYLLDTVMIEGEKCQDLGFVPRVSESFGFTGHLYVTLDSTYFIKRAKMNIPHDINLNFISYLSMDQVFERTPDNTRLLVKDDVTIEFKLIDASKGIFARRTNAYQKHSFAAPADEKEIFATNGIKSELPEARYRDKEYWETSRPIPIEEKENAVKKLMENLREIPAFYYGEKLVSTIVGGYLPTRAEKSKFEIGPINTLISGNSFEGARFRLGGITSAYLNERIFGKGYVAYGTKDRKFKYLAEVEYSFLDKKEYAHEFPVHSLRASYFYDINQLGQQYLFTNKDNIVLSLKRKPDDRITYLRKAELSYQRETAVGWSYNVALRNKIEYATDVVKFEKQITPDQIESVNNYMVTEAEFKIRYAPYEKFYQMKTKRRSISPEVPKVFLSHTIARKGFLGSDYNYNRTEVGFEKRFWFSAFGYLDTYVRAGKIWDEVPFPMLAIPNANLSYTIQPESYALMNAVEFINDQYASWDVTYFMNGLIFNRIPLIKYMKLREVFAFRGLYGNLSDKNNPKYNNSLFIFPQETYEMGKKPYMEASVGIENIFKLMRLDYVWRLSYRDHPNINTSGLRVSMHVTF
ncbi:MAG: DUF5686 family protein [Bacteroidales bacterium]